jgi:hypothetical protein
VKPRYAGFVAILDLGAGDPVGGKITKFVSTSDGHVDVNEFADLAIADWTRFLTARGLIVETSPAEDGASSAARSRAAAAGAAGGS